MADIQRRIVSDLSGPPCVADTLVHVQQREKFLVMIMDVLDDHGVECDSWITLEMDLREVIGRFLRQS